MSETVPPGRRGSRILPCRQPGRRRTCSSSASSPGRCRAGSAAVVRPIRAAGRTQPQHGKWNCNSGSSTLRSSYVSSPCRRGVSRRVFPGHFAIVRVRLCRRGPHCDMQRAVSWRQGTARCGRPQDWSRGAPASPRAAPRCHVRKCERLPPTRRARPNVALPPLGARTADAVHGR